MRRAPSLKVLIWQSAAHGPPQTVRDVDQVCIRTVFRGIIICDWNTPRVEVVPAHLSVFQQRLVGYRCAVQRYMAVILDCLGHTASRIGLVYVGVA